MLALKRRRTRPSGPGSHARSVPARRRGHVRAEQVELDDHGILGEVEPEVVVALVGKASRVIR
jgi:hypothetical protein